MTFNPEITTKTACIYDDVAAVFAFGEVGDDYGCRYFGARYYDPNISIWLSVDPLSDKYPSFSPYAYVYNKPIVMEDIDGYFGTRAGALLFKVRNGIKGNISKTEDGVHFVTRERDNAQFAFHQMGTGYEAKKKNWGGIGFFRLHGGGSGDNETRHTMDDVPMMNIDLLLDVLDDPGAATHSPEAPESFIEATLNAAKSIQNIQKGYKMLESLGDDTGLIQEGGENSIHPLERIQLHYSHKNKDGTTTEGSLTIFRKDSAAIVEQMRQEGCTNINKEEIK